MRRKTPYIFSSLLCFCFFSTFAIGIKHPNAPDIVKFTENKNQWEKRVLYRAQLDGGLLFLENNCFTYNFYDKETLHKNHVRKKTSPDDVPNDKIRSHAFRMTFLNASPGVKAEATHATPDYSNFFIGNDKRKWVGNVKNYREINYSGLYAGIDLQVLGLQNSIKYNFIVAPGADPDKIRLFYEGIDKISLERGALRLTTSVNELVEEKPYAYQMINGKQVEVKCEFVLEGHSVYFRFPKGYNKNARLVIDPVLVFACSTGSTADNFGMTATYDDNGNLYAGGTAFDQGYPTTLGVYDPSYNGIVQGGRTDVVITKYDASGTFLMYSTYFGGAAGTEVISSLIVNNRDELMLFGATGSSDFPVTATAFDTSFNGGPYLVFPNNGTEYLNGTDIYVAKFNSSGTNLLASTFIGGSDNDGANNSGTLAFNYGDYYRGEIQTDTAGNCYISSCTYSTDFPTTPGCFQSGTGGGMDGVVFKLDSTLTTMVWGTYLGGLQDDGCYALTIDNFFNVYTTGGTSSPNFPITPGAYGSAYAGGTTDGFVTRIKNDGTTILSSTFVGTSLYDQSFLIQLDNSYNVYIVGQSKGVMPVSAGVYSNPNSKQFIWKMDPDLTTTLVTTIFGNGNGQVNIAPSAFLVDICGNIYVCGWGGNILTGFPTNGMPVTPGAYQTSTDGFNFYLLVLTANASSLLYGTYFGGPSSREHVDGGTSRFDKKGIVYQGVCAGCGGRDDFPVTPGSWPYSSPSYVPFMPGFPSTGVNSSTNCNMGVFKFDFQVSGANANANIFPNDTICEGESVAFNNVSYNALNYLWDFGDGSAQSTVVSPTHMYALAGSYNVTLIAFDSTGCVHSDTSHLVVNVVAPPVLNLGSDITVCQTPSELLDAGTSASIYNWSTGDTTQTIIADTAGLYWVEIDNRQCKSRDSLVVREIILDPFLGNDTSLCAGQTLFLNAFESGATYLWSTGATGSSITVSTAGQYWVRLTSGPCTESDTIQVNYIPYPVTALSNLTICENATAVLDAGTPATRYLWSTSDTTRLITVSAPGTYSVTVSNFQCSKTDSAVVQQIIFHPSLGNDTSLCAGQTLTLNASQPGGSYLWSTGQTSPSITVSTAGQYWVRVTVGPCAQADTMNVNYIPYPVIGLPVGVIICPQDSVVLNAVGPATSYLWSTSDTTQTITISSPGTYSVTASNFQCSATESTIAQQVVFPGLGNDTSLCAGQTILLDVFYPGASYLWSTGATTSSLTVASAGQYFVKISFAGCSRSDTIIVNYLAYPVINLATGVTICSGDTVILDAGSPATAYLWSTGATTQTISATSGGTYSVTVSNQQCSSTATATIQQPYFTPLIADSTLCTGQSITLNAFSSGATYLWSTGATSPTITVSSPGQYWVTVSSTFCQNRDTVDISYLPYPVVNLPQSIELCPQSSLTLNAGNSASAYLWSNGAQTSAIDVANGGTYIVTASNQQCSVKDTAIVNAVEPIMWNSAATLCDVEKYRLDAGAGANSYSWSTGETTQSIDISEAGVYWVIANTNSCVLSDTITIEGGLGSGVLWFPNSFTPNSNGLNDRFTGKGADITYFDLMIFDRWGELIFETEKPSEGWDGMYKGRPVEQDVYVWKVKYKTLCSNGLIHTKIGHVTVVR